MRRPFPILRPPLLLPNLCPSGLLFSLPCTHDRVEGGSLCSQGQGECMPRRTCRSHDRASPFKSLRTPLSCDPYPNDFFPQNVSHTMLALAFSKTTLVVALLSAVGSMLPHPVMAENLG